MRDSVRTGMPFLTLLWNSSVTVTTVSPNRSVIRMLILSCRFGKTKLHAVESVVLRTYVVTTVSRSSGLTLTSQVPATDARDIGAGVGGAASIANVPVSAAGGASAFEHAAKTSANPSRAVRRIWTPLNGISLKQHGNGQSGDG